RARRVRSSAMRSGSALREAATHRVFGSSVDGFGAFAPAMKSPCASTTYQPSPEANFVIAIFHGAGVASRLSLSSSSRSIIGASNQALDDLLSAPLRLLIGWRIAHLA